MSGKIISINISKKVGDKKSPVESALFVKDSGIEGDAHAGSKRQVSLLAVESIRKMGAEFKPGEFAENLTTEGIDIVSLPIGAELKLGKEVVIKITAHGKECHDHCAIYKKHGQCVMPKEGVFAEVVSGGVVKSGDSISL